MTWLIVVVSKPPRPNGHHNNDSNDDEDHDQPAAHPLASVLLVLLGLDQFIDTRLHMVPRLAHLEASTRDVATENTSAVLSWTPLISLMKWIAFMKRISWKLFIQLLCENRILFCLYALYVRMVPLRVLRHAVNTLSTTKPMLNDMNSFVCTLGRHHGCCC